MTDGTYSTVTTPTVDSSAQCTSVCDNVYINLGQLPSSANTIYIPPTTESTSQPSATNTVNSATSDATTINGIASAAAAALAIAVLLI